MARVSDREQEKNYSIPAQLQRMRDYAGNNSITVIKEFVFVESSTRHEVRKKYEEVIRFVNKHKGTALITDTIDRLQRDFKESVELDELRKKEVLELHFIRENLVVNRDSCSSDILRWDMGVMFAKSYILQLRDNIKRSNQKKLREGEYPGRAPLGYINVFKSDGTISTRKNKIREPKWIVPDPITRHLVKKAFELYSTGNYTYKGLAKTMRKLGLLTKSGKGVSKSCMEDVINNSFYYGEMKYNGELYKHKYVPLITRNLFEKCQSVRISKGFTKFFYNGS